MNLTNESKAEANANVVRYTLEELKAFSKLPESLKTPVVPCQKGDCIFELFVPHRQHHVKPSPHQQLNSKESISRTWRVSRSSRENINIAGLSPTSALTKKSQILHIHLSLQEEVKLSECENAWQPKFLSKNLKSHSPTTDCSKNEDDDIEDVLKKVRGILNKLTSDNFNVLIKEMTNININTQEKMENVMILIFEKTVSEPNFAPTYAKFSKVLFEEVKGEMKTILFGRLQTEFENNVDNVDAKDRKLQPILCKLKEVTDQKERIELQEELELQEYQFRRRAWGTVRFIGEVYKLNLLSPNRVLKCVECLLKHGNEEKLEYMCKLLTTVGGLLEGNVTDTKTRNAIKLRMNNIFTEMQKAVKDAKDPNKKGECKISSRVRFMMQDVIDLRSKNWGPSSNSDNNHVAAALQRPEDKNRKISSAGSQNAWERDSAQLKPLGDKNRINQIPTKESRFGGSGGNNFVQQASKSQVNGSAQDTMKLGSSSMYDWHKMIGRNTKQSNDSGKSDGNSLTSLQLNKEHQQNPEKQKQQTQNLSTTNQNSNEDIESILSSCTNKDKQRMLNHMLEEYLDCLPSGSDRWREEVLHTWKNTNEKQQICLMHYILMEYLHLGKVKQLERNACANIFIYLMKCEAFNKATFTRAYEEFAKEFPDLLMDVPNGWTYVMEFLGPLLQERVLTFTDIWQSNWRNDQQFTERCVQALVHYFTKEFGTNYTRDLWHNEFKLDKGQLFMSDQQQWQQFIENNKLQFLNDSKATPEISDTTADNNNSAAIAEQHVQHLKNILSSPNNSKAALDYINTNVDINLYFLKKLTRFVSCDFTSAASSSRTKKTSRACSNTSISSNSSTKDTDLLSEKKQPQLNKKAFRKNCLPLLRLSIDTNEDRELTCIDSVVGDIQQEYGSDSTNNANELICGIFDILHDAEVIKKGTFEKWYKRQQQQESQNQMKWPLSDTLDAYMQQFL